MTNLSEELQRLNELVADIKIGYATPYDTTVTMPDLYTEMCRGHELANKLHEQMEARTKSMQAWIDHHNERADKAEAERDKYKALLVQAEAAIRTVIEDGVQITEGPYKQHKNNKCAHGQWGYEGCEACVADYLQPTLTALHAAGIGRE